MNGDSAHRRLIETPFEVPAAKRPNAVKHDAILPPPKYATTQQMPKAIPCDRCGQHCFPLSDQIFSCCSLCAEAIASELRAIMAEQALDKEIANKNHEIAILKAEIKALRTEITNCNPKIIC